MLQMPIDWSTDDGSSAGWHDVQALMSGNHPVVASNHTVILNWNRETIPLLQQIAICQLERGSSAFQGCAMMRSPARACSVSSA
jgi:hypothetical protein